MPCYKPTSEVLEMHGFRWCEITRRWRKGISGIWAELQLHVRASGRIEINAVSESGEDCLALRNGTLTDSSHFDEVVSEALREAIVFAPEADPVFYVSNTGTLVLSPQEEQAQLNTELTDVAARVLAGDPTHAVEDRKFLLGLMTTFYQGVVKETQELYDTVPAGTPIAAPIQLVLEALAAKCGYPLRHVG
jgi:hypothetical protein